MLFQFMVVIMGVGIHFVGDGGVVSCVVVVVVGSICAAAIVVGVFFLIVVCGVRVGGSGVFCCCFC